MTKATITAAIGVTAFVLVAALALGVAFVVRGPDPRVVEPAPATPATSAAAPAAIMYQGFIYGRITTIDSDIYEGRLRWGRDQEAFWNDYFNGNRDGNPWAVHAPFAQPRQERSLEIFGLKFGGGGRDKLDRTFMSRFGDIARIDARVREVDVALKSGTLFTLDRFKAGDIDDGVRVWDAKRGVVDVDARRIRTIEFLPTAPSVAAPARLHGTVRTRQGDFTGFILWDRHDCLSTDELDGRSAEREVSVRYDTIRSIARHSADSALVTLVDGREMVLSGSREVGRGNRGIYVDDTRYGRVLISWDAFERVEFSAGGSGPGYGEFAPGRALAGSITTRDGRRLAGRLVYNFAESETTETLDAAVPGVDYTILFSLIASIVPQGRDGRGDRATVILDDGEELALERTYDLADGNAGMLIFVDGRKSPEYVPWTDVAQIDLDHRRIP